MLILKTVFLDALDQEDGRVFQKVLFNQLYR
jgi:hypothetical protein